MKLARVYTVEIVRRSGTRSFWRFDNEQDALDFYRKNVQKDDIAKITIVFVRFD